jgi:hypothetical protein
VKLPVSRNCYLILGTCYSYIIVEALAEQKVVSTKNPRLYSEFQFSLFEMCPALYNPRSAYKHKEPTSSCEVEQTLLARVPRYRTFQVIELYKMK